MKLTHLLCALVAFAAAPAALQAQTKTAIAGERAVEAAIKDRLGSQYRVTFENPTERILSLTEMVVTGSGHVRRQDDWRFDRSFDFTVKVSMDGSRNRDLQVTFDDGERIVRREESSSAPRDKVHLSKPNWYETLDSNQVTFEGLAQRDVTITVFDSRNSRVAQTTARTRNGGFRAVIELPEGQFRAVVSEGSGDESDEVRFAVTGDSHDWGHPDPVLRIQEPSKDGRLPGPRVTLSGFSTERFVRVQLTDGRNNLVIDRSLPTTNNFWSTQVELTNGSYNLMVEAGRMRESRRFQVFSSFSGMPVQSPLQVNEPANGGTYTGPRVTVAGNSGARNVSVRVLDERNNTVIERSVPTTNNYWNTSLPLEAGIYQIQISDGSSRQPEVRRIRVKGTASPSGGLMISLRVTEPKRDSTAKGPRVTIAGNSSESVVRVMVWDARQNRITDRNVPTRGGYWNTQVPLSPGRYRVRVEARSGRDYEEFFFDVK